MRFYLNEFYSDTLLALGIAAAYDAAPVYTGTNYVFPETGLEPIKFPVMQLENEPLDVPFNYHRFKSSAISAFAGRKLLEFLEDMWNTMLPTYDEVAELVMRVGAPDWPETRFWNQSGNNIISTATFRPLSMKGQNNTKASGIAIKTLGEFWLLDALRAIGFLTYAQPKWLTQEAATARWLVFVPVLPNVEFSHRFLHTANGRTSIATQVQAHLLAAELVIPRLFVAKYAELNPMARTIMSIFGIEPRSISQPTIYDLNGVLASAAQLSISEANRVLLSVLKALEGDLSEIENVPTAGFRYQQKIGASFRNISVDTLTDLLTCEPLIDLHRASI
jgi:hypothetical protein